MIPASDFYSRVTDENERETFIAAATKYRERRRRWAWKIGRPYSGDLVDPDPGVLDAADPEAG